MEDFVTYKLAKKLKENGYPQHWSDYDYIVENEYDDNFEVGSRYDRCFIPEHLPTISAPTIYQVLKWLRDEKKLHVEPCVISREEVEFAPKYTYWSFGIMSIEGGYFIYQEYHKFNDDNFDSYEEAALSAIEYVLNNNLI